MEMVSNLCLPIPRINGCTLRWDRIARSGELSDRSWKFFGAYLVERLEQRRCGRNRGSHLAQGVSSQKLFAEGGSDQNWRQKGDRSNES